MIERARAEAGDRSIRFVEADFMRYHFDEQFDFIGASASLHHVPFGQALEKMASLLRPGGVLAVLGLFREASLTDTAVARVAAPVNVFYALSRGWDARCAPIKPPDMSEAQRSARPFIPTWPVHASDACCSGGISLPGRSRRHLQPHLQACLRRSADLERYCLEAELPHSRDSVDFRSFSPQLFNH
jgi:SAM-dependent methyltransferase